MSKKAAKSKTVYLINNGDFRQPACVQCWPKQEETLKAVKSVLKSVGVDFKVLPEFDKKRGHGFLSRQCEGAEVFSRIEPDAPVVVVLSMWAYAHHVVGPLGTHRGPVLLLANFDGTWPGLVALLNHGASLARCGIAHSRLWTDKFLKDARFVAQLGEWCKTGTIAHSTAHLSDAAGLKLSARAQKLGDALAGDIRRNKRILGQLDPGCMGMLNAVLSPGALAGIGMPVELLNQSDLLAEMRLVPEAEAIDQLNWLVKKGCHFVWGHDKRVHLTPDQVVEQMRMYVAAARFYERYGLSAIGIPYQYGLVRSCPASDLVEGMLNNAERPDVKSPDTGKVIAKGSPIVHFNEGDIGAGVPQVLMRDIYQRKDMPAETTLHDVRWGGMVDGRFVWQFEISGGAPPAHFGGWKETTVYRQPGMYFPLGGGTCAGVSKPGPVTWARFYEAFGSIGMDCGLGEVVPVPDKELRQRRESTTPEWPIANVYIPGYGRDELMSTHMSNHIVIGYGDILEELAATCLHLGIPTRIGGDVRNRLS